MSLQRELVSESLPPRGRPAQRLVVSFQFVEDHSVQTESGIDQVHCSLSLDLPGMFQ